MPIEWDEILFRVSATFYGAFLGVLTWSAAARVIDWGDVAKGNLAKLWPSFCGSLGILLSAAFFIVIWKKWCDPLAAKLKDVKGWWKCITGFFTLALVMLNAANSWIFYLIFTMGSVHPEERLTYAIISMVYFASLFILYVVLKKC